MARKAAIGISDFCEVIEKGCFYVDKTNFIKEWWETEDKVTLATRPRRFGKTLTMSMVEHFFSIKYAGSRLFEGLSIWQDEAYRVLQGTYPVIFLSFAGIRERSFQEAYHAVCKVLAREYNRCFFLTGSSCLTPPEKDAFIRMAYGQAPPEDISASISQLSEFLCRYYNKKAMILLDEYDTPMQEAYVNGYWEEMVQFIKGLFGAAFKDNPYLERALLTGITRVSKESLFSGLNNLEVATVTSHKYETVFGFTEKEVFDALDEFGLQSSRQSVKKWYDGFQFGQCGSIYNPWSIVNFLAKKEFAPYWANTSSNGLVGELIRKGSREVKLAVEDLLQGKPITAIIDEQVVFNQLDYDDEAIWSLLLASGYLKASHYDAATMACELAITNYETVQVFEKLARGWFANGRADYNGFVKALLAGHTEEMNIYMNKVALHTFSSFDSGRQPSGSAEPERFYHGFVLGLIVELRGRYAITSNRESGYGRYDVMLEPLKTGDDGVILEFKVYDKKKEQSLEATADAALRQILDKKYAAVLEAKGAARGRIRIYGFAFEGKEALIKGGLVQDYEKLCSMPEPMP